MSAFQVKMQLRMQVRLELLGDCRCSEVGVAAGEG